MSVRVPIAPRQLQGIVETVSEFAREAELVAPQNVFFLCGRSLISSKLVFHSPWIYDRILALHGQLVPVTVPLRANEIYLRTNLRVVGLNGAPNLTAKIMAGRPNGGSLFRDVRARRMIGRGAPSGRLTTPPVVRLDARGRWLIEQFIAQPHAREEELAEFVGSAAVELYQPTARLRPLESWPMAATAARALATLDSTFPAIRSSDQWLVALGHGDLKHHNLLQLPSGGYCLVDLEFAGVYPVAYDLARTYVMFPRAKSAIIALLRKLDPLGRTAPPALQLAFCVAALSADVADREGLSLSQTRAGMARPRAAATYDRRLVEITQLLDGLRQP